MAAKAMRVWNAQDATAGSRTADSSSSAGVLCRPTGGATAWEVANSTPWR